MSDWEGETEAECVREMEREGRQALSILSNPNTHMKVEGGREEGREGGREGGRKEGRECVCVCERERESSGSEDKAIWSCQR
jgi:hypothetical protein